MRCLAIEVKAIDMGLSGPNEVDCFFCGERFLLDPGDAVMVLVDQRHDILGTAHCVCAQRHAVSMVADPSNN